VPGRNVGGQQRGACEGVAKLTGKTRRGWNVGLLDAVTARERAKTVTDGVGSTSEVEPLSNSLPGA
jgi:hypothetical protein